MLRAKIKRQLPPDFQKWLFFEQVYHENPYISEKNRAFRRVVPYKFWPRQGNHFFVPYIEIPRERTICLDTDPPQKILDIIYPTSKTVRFFFHPLMKGLFPKAKIRRQFYATPTASFRTVLLWDRNMELEPIMLKLHISRIIGGTERIITQPKLRQSVGITAALNGIDPDELNAVRFGYLPEPLNVFEPRRNMGLIIRDPVPRPVDPQGKNKGVILIPLFSLNSRGPHLKPLIVRLVEASGLSPEEYLFKYIVEPLIKSWTYLTLSQGLIPEPHAQNLLLEMDKDGNPRRFIYRDFEGVAVDFLIRKKRQLNNEYFNIGGVSDFHADRAVQSFRASYRYFINLSVFSALLRSLSHFYPHIDKVKFLKRAHRLLIDNMQPYSSVSIRKKSLTEIYQLLRS